MIPEAERDHAVRVKVWVTFVLALATIGMLTHADGSHWYNFVASLFWVWSLRLILLARRRSKRLQSFNQLNRRQNVMAVRTCCGCEVGKPEKGCRCKCHPRRATKRQLLKAVRTRHESNPVLDALKTRGR